MKVRRVEREEGSGIYTCPLNFIRCAVALAHNLGLRNMYSTSFGVLAFAIVKLAFRKNTIISLACGFIGCALTHNAIKIYALISGQCRNQKSGLESRHDVKLLEQRSNVSKSVKEITPYEKIKVGREESIYWRNLTSEKKNDFPERFNVKFSRRKTSFENLDEFVEKINSNEEIEVGSEKRPIWWGNLTSIIRSNELQEDYSEKLILKQLNKIKNLDTLKHIVRMLINDRFLNFKSVMNLLPEVLPEERIEGFKYDLESMLKENLKARFTKAHFSSGVTRGVSVSSGIIDYVNANVPFNLIDTEELFIRIISKVLDYTLTFMTNNGHPRSRYLDSPDNNNELPIKLKLSYGKIFITGKKNACQTINCSTTSIPFTMHGYRFLLRQMVNNKEKLSKKEFLKHKKFLKSKIQSYIRHSSNQYYCILICENSISFLEAICDYFDPIKNLVTEAMTKEISNLIDDNIEILVDFKNLTKQQKKRLSRAFKKINICGRVRDIYLEERLSFVHENINSNAIYSEEERQSKTFSIHILSCPSISVNPLFLQMNL